jgi:uncharacterized protein Usg
MDNGFLRQIEGFSLTTAEILYRFPDHPQLLQSYIWQDYDLAPRFPSSLTFSISGRLIWRARSTASASPIAG